MVKSVRKKNILGPAGCTFSAGLFVSAPKRLVVSSGRLLSSKPGLILPLGVKKQRQKK